MSNLLSINDLTAERIHELVLSAIALKTDLKQGRNKSPLVLDHKSMVMIFDKASLRTRLSFEIAMTQLGGHAVYLAPDDIKLGKRESIGDTAKVISSMADIIIARVSSHESIVELGAYSQVPVINAMTDLEHPCQVLADLQTIYEHFNRLKNIKIAYVGDANNNVTNSWVFAAQILGLEMSVSSPPDFESTPTIKRLAPTVKYFQDPIEAVRGANVVITDTWVSMGKEAEAERRLKILNRYQVTSKLMKVAARETIFLHCMPAHRGQEVTAAVMDGPQSAAFIAAENRLHMQKAILLSLAG